MRVLDNFYRSVFAILGSLAVIQSAIGFSQFLSQSSGPSSIIVNNARIIRAYGTFPHPNVMAAFLLLGLFSLYGLFLESRSKRLFTPLLITTGIFIVLIGLTLTFSRTGWVIAVLLTAAVFIYEFWQGSESRERVRELAIIVVAICALLFATLQPYISSRARFSLEEPAVSLRLAYNKIGWEIIKQKPLGVGLGKQVEYAAKNNLYEKYGLTEPWQKQPIHDLYLLMASEIGVLGLLVFSAFILKILLSARGPLVMIMLSSLLLFGLTDHFLWTTLEGQLMFWLTVGLVMRLNKADI